MKPLTAASALGILLGLSVVASVSQAADNIYTNALSGKWESATNWSLGAPIAADSLFITNSGSKIVTIDSTTTGSFSNTLTVTNLALGGIFGGTNTLQLSQAGPGPPLHVLFELSLRSNAVVTVNNSTVQADGAASNGGLSVGTTANGSHNLVVVTNGGKLVSGQAEIGGVSGFDDTVLVTGTNSVWFNTNYSLAVLDSSPGLALAVSNGGRFVGNSVYLGDSASADGNVILITDPGSSWTNTGILSVGGPSQGDQFVVSNGATAYSATSVVGYVFGRSHSVLLTGTNSLWASDGTLQIGAGGSNDFVMVSNGASLLLSNAAHNAEVDVNQASLIVSGGFVKADILSLLSVGSNSSVATVSITGGGLFVTNANGTATTTVDGGSLLHEAGVFKTDNLVVTNGGSVTTSSNTSFSAADIAGTLNAPNVGVGNDGSPNNGTGSGSLTVSTNGVIHAASLYVGSSAGGLGNVVVHGTVHLSADLVIQSGSPADTSSVTVDGLFTATNGTLAIGPSGSGIMNIPAGTTTANQIKLGGTGPGSSGSLILSPGAHLKFLSSLSANYVDVGGDIDGNGGGALYVGEGHDAAVFVTQGSINNVSTISVGFVSGYTGTLTVSSAGQVQATTNFIVGDCVSQAIGLVTLNGGTLYVTNAAHTAILDVRNGMFTLNSGARLVVDNLVITNACGHLINNGGSIIYNNPLRPGPVLDPNQDADGDGTSNTNEIRAGTDPLNPSSSFRLLSASIVNGHDVRLDWTAVGGHSYVVQFSTNLAGGQSANFHDLSTNSVGGTNETTTNYVQSGGATNPAGFYRVRLGP